RHTSEPRSLLPVFTMNGILIMFPYDLPRPRRPAGRAVAAAHPPGPPHPETPSGAARARHHPGPVPAAADARPLPVAAADGRSGGAPGSGAPGGDDAGRRAGGGRHGATGTGSGQSPG